MKSLDQAIARVRAQLRFIPTLALRQARILAFLNEVTGSSFSFAYLYDDLGLHLSGVVWPPPSPSRLLLMHQLGPCLLTLFPNSDLLTSAWDQKPGSAFVLPDEQFRTSLIYRFIARPLDERHLAIFPYPERPDGSQVAVILTRGHTGVSYEAGALRVTEQICAAFAAEMSAVEPARFFMPTHPAPSAHTFRLDAAFRPERPSLYVQSLLALFYDEPGTAAAALTAARAPALPAALETELRACRDQSLRLADPTFAGLTHAFSKKKLGRVLLLFLESHPGADYRLTLHEDLSQHALLRRIKGACRALPRDRRAIFSACLVIAEGVQSSQEIARRTGFAALAPSSATRLINRARTIVAAASGNSPSLPPAP